VGAESFFFYLFGVIVLAGALGVVVMSNPVYSAISLVLCFFALAGEYVLLHAHFVAAAQVLVYAGAIMVLFLFVIMLMNPTPADAREAGGSALLGWLLGGLFFAAIFVALITARLPGSLPVRSEVSGYFGSVEQIGAELFTRYLWPFETAGVILLVGIVGVVVLARLHRKEG